MGTKNIRVSFLFDGRGFIGNPYNKCTQQKLEVERQVHPKLKGQKREQALEKACSSVGLSGDDYVRVLEENDRGFVLGSDGDIIIPERNLRAFINNISQEAPSNIPKIKNKGLAFAALQFPEGGLYTGIALSEAKTWERPVRNENSSVPFWVTSKYISGFTASGTIVVDESIIKEKDLRELIEFGGKYIFLGSCRKQGWGSFKVSKWEVVK